FVQRAEKIVAAHGKKLLGWEQLVATKLSRSTLVQYWTPASGSDPAADNARAAAKQGVKIVMTPANHTYLDMKYTEATPIGQDWAGLVELGVGFYRSPQVDWEV